MKISFPKGYKTWMTLEDVDRTKEVAAGEKEDVFTPKDYAEMAANMALKHESDYFEKVLEAKAEFARNARIWNDYTDNSGNMDIWISATVKTAKGFMEIGAYVTDIWQRLGSDYDYRDQMYIVKYRRAV